MIMKKKTTGKILNRIFEESEKGTHSSEELDKKLQLLGVDPDKLVENGLQNIQRLLKKQQASTVDNNENVDRFLMAAKKNKNEFNLDQELKDIKKRKG